MPGKKKRAKKAKPKAAKVGKGSPGKAKPKTAKASAGAKAANGSSAFKAKPEGKAEPNGKEKPKMDLAPLRKQAEEGKAALEKAGREADALRAKARDVEAKAKATYAEAVSPYRDACRKAGVECEFAGGRATNVTPAVHFLIEKAKGDIKVAIKGRPETEGLLMDKALGESVSRAAYVGYSAMDEPDRRPCRPSGRMLEAGESDSGFAGRLSVMPAGDKG